MTPRVERLFNRLYYSQLNEYEIKQLIVGLTGMLLTDISFRDTANTVMNYQLDEAMQQEEHTDA